MLTMFSRTACQCIFNNWIVICIESLLTWNGFSIVTAADDSLSLSCFKGDNDGRATPSMCNSCHASSEMWYLSLRLMALCSSIFQVSCRFYSSHTLVTQKRFDLFFVWWHLVLVRTFSAMYDHTLLNLQISSLVIGYGHFNLPEGFVLVCMG